VRRRRAVRPQVQRSAFAGFRFPPEVITVAVRWYLRYGRSYRDVEELLAERGIDVDHVTIYRWVQRFTLLFAGAAHPLRHAPGNRWFVDETYVKVAGRWRYLYRAVDNTARSSMCCCPNSGTPPRPAASSSVRCVMGRRRSR
jgi:IS6 family transposase